MKEIFSLFYTTKKRDFYYLFIIIFISSLIEFFSFSLIIPVIYLISDTSVIRGNAVFNYIYTALHFTSYYHFIFFLLLCMVVLFILKNQFLLFTSYKLNKFSYSVALDVVQRQITWFYKTDYLDMKNRNTAQYLRSLVEAPQVFADFLMMPMIYILNEMLVIILIAAGLLLYKPYIVVLIIVTIVPASYLMLHMAKARLHKISSQKGTLESASYLETKEGIYGYADIKLSGNEQFYIEKIKNNFTSLFDINVQRNVYLLFPRRIIEVMVILVIFVIYGLASFVFNFSSGALILLLITFATAAYRLLPSINEIFTHVINIRTWEFIFDLLDVIKAPSIEKSREYPALAFDSKFELKEISFKYSEHEKNIIEGLNLTVNKGEVIVIKGESGTGKTTVTKLMAGFIKPYAGMILIDGKELLHLDQIKSKLAYVTQDFYLFDKTVIENIALGEEIEKMDMESIHRIITTVGLSGFVRSLPLGLFQPIGEMGSKMSGGEKQRLALARALYKKAELLILDEATSSLDKENEQLVLDAIYSIAKKEKLTVIIISHRFTFINNFDVLYELSDGGLKAIS